MIMATDGDLNIGVTDQGSLTRLIEDEAKSGVYLSVLGFGEGNLADARMEALADHGNGNYSYIDDIAKSVPEEDSLKLSYRSVMGVEIPIVTIDRCESPELVYGLQMTDPTIDEAYACFREVKRLTADLAEVENSVYRLADSIKKTQKRANALKNIMIPRFEQGVKFITEALDEKDREEFSRLKVIKAQKAKKENKVKAE